MQLFGKNLFFLLLLSPLQILFAQNNLSFVENKKQWEGQILYQARIPGGFLWIKNNSIQYSFYDYQKISEIHASRKKYQTSSLPSQENTNEIKAHSFEVNLLNGNQITPQGIKIRNEKRNYFLGKDPKKWASEVNSFQEISYPNIYEGINLNFFQLNGYLKYEFIVAPQANPQEILMQYNAVNPQLDAEGNLILQTSVNKIIEKKPYCYQNVNGRKIEIPSKFVLNNNTLSFEFPEGYDKNYELIIDPTLIFSTYSGSFADNWGNTATFDDSGSMYMGGTVFGTNFPTTIGAFTVTFQGEVDVAIHKYSSQGSNLLYATYLGGDKTEVPHSMIVNANNELIVMGTTGSANYPTTTSAFDQTFNNLSSTPLIVPMGGIVFETGSDIFITKFNNTGSNLLASTFVGGTGNDGVNISTDVSIRNYGDQFRGEVLLDNSDNIYVVSTTNSTDFPTTTGAYKTTISGSQDMILMKFPSDLSTQTWSTYFGGNGFDAGYGIRIASNDDIFITGGTTSSNLPTQVGALNSTARGDDDGFIAKFTNAGTFQQVTYLGTSAADQCFLIDLDENDEVYVVGQTLGNYPVSSGVYSNNNGKQFIHKIDNNLSTTRFSTVFGSGRTVPDISPTAFLVNDCQNMYVTGWGGVVNDNSFIIGGRTYDMPITNDAYKITTDSSDYYIIILEKDAQNILYGSYFGSDGVRGDHVDGGTSRFDKKGIIYHAACACSNSGTSGSSDFPTTPQAWSNTNNSFNCNMAAFKFDIEIVRPDFNIVDAANFNVVTQGCFPFESIFDYTGTSVTTIEWFVNGVSVGTGDNLTYTFQNAGNYNVEARVVNNAACVKEGRISKNIIIVGSTVNAGADVSICKIQNTQLSATPSGTVVNYRWVPITGLDNPNIQNPVASPEVTTEYSVIITDNNGCTAEDRVIVEVLPQIIPDFDIGFTGNCGDPLLLNIHNKSQEANIFTWEMGNGTIITENPTGYIYPENGTYQVTLTASNGICEERLIKEIIIEDNETPLPNVITPNGDGKNDFFVLPNRTNYNLQIINHWGVEIYQQDNYQNDWGEGIASGTYYFVATSRYGIECKGWLQVLK